MHNSQRQGAIFHWFSRNTQKHEAHALENKAVCHSSSADVGVAWMGPRRMQATRRPSRPATVCARRQPASIDNEWAGEEGVTKGGESLEGRGGSQEKEASRSRIMVAKGLGARGVVCKCTEWSATAG